MNMRSRSKDGCLTCRVRHKACDKEFDDGVCANCRRLNIQCLGIREDRYAWMRDDARLRALTDEIKLWTSKRANYESGARPPPLSLDHHMVEDDEYDEQYRIAMSSGTMQRANLRDPSTSPVMPPPSSPPQSSPTASSSSRGRTQSFQSASRSPEHPTFVVPSSPPVHTVPSARPSGVVHSVVVDQRQSWPEDSPHPYYPVPSALPVGVPNNTAYALPPEAYYPHPPQQTTQAYPPAVGFPPVHSPYGAPMPVAFQQPSPYPAAYANPQQAYPYPQNFIQHPPASPYPPNQPSDPQFMAEAQGAYPYYPTNAPNQPYHGAWYPQEPPAGEPPNPPPYPPPPSQ